MHLATDPTHRTTSTASRIARTVLVVAAALVVAAGCGGDDAAPTATTAAPPATTAASTSTTAPATTSPATTSPATTSPATTTTVGSASDEARVRAAYVAFFDGASPSVDAKVALLENGEKYRSMLVDASANAQFQKLAATVRAVRFPGDAACAASGVTAPCAAVTFDLLVGGFPMLAAHESFAVSVGGTWKVAAKAWCDVVAVGGESCPS